MRIDSSLYNIKVVHTHTEASSAAPTTTAPELMTTIVRFCMWHIYAHHRPEAEWMKEHEVMTCNWLPSVSECNRVRASILPLFAGRWYMQGRAYALLMDMCVDLVWQRHGVGRMLMRWGTDRCDELGILAYLEASLFGYPLHWACGFEEFEPFGHEH